MEHLPLTPLRAAALAAGVLLFGGSVVLDAQSATSINSTSTNQKCGQNGQPACKTTVVPQQTFSLGTSFRVLAVNDLGMHCGDLDTRVASILPPFNVVNAQVLTIGATPTLQTPQNNTRLEVVYSATFSANDPAILDPSLQPNPPASFTGTKFKGVFKTNFWDVARKAYDPFYPAGVLPLFYPALDVNNKPFNIVDLGLPVPDNELLYLADKDGFKQGTTVLDQEGMPSVLLTTSTCTQTQVNQGAAGCNPPFQPKTIVDSPYATSSAGNAPQAFKLFFKDMPFFSASFGSTFGYVANNVN